MTQKKIEVIVNGGWKNVSVGTINSMFEGNLHLMMGKNSFVPKVKSFDKTIVLNTNSGMTETDFAKLLKKLVKTPLNAKKNFGFNRLTGLWYETIHINIDVIQPEFLETFLQKFLEKMQTIESWAPTYNDNSIAPEKTVVSQSAPATAPAFVPAPAPATSYWASQPAPAPATRGGGDSNFPPLRTSAESVQLIEVASPAPKVPVELVAQPAAQQDVSVDSLGQKLKDLQNEIERDKKKVLDAKETILNLTVAIERNKEALEKAQKAYCLLLQEKLAAIQQGLKNTTHSTQAAKDNKPYRLWGDETTEEALADAKAAANTAADKGILPVSAQADKETNPCLWWGDKSTEEALADAKAATAAANTATATAAKAEANTAATATAKGIQPVSAHDDNEFLGEMVQQAYRRRRRQGK